MIEQFAARTDRTASERTLARLKELCAGTQVVVLANRQPFTHTRESGRIVAAHCSSGVVNAVEPLVAACGGVWVAHASGSADRDAITDRDGLGVPPEAPRYRLRRVWLTADEERGYYDGFANEGLWPLCHRAHVRPTFRSSDLQTYWMVNGRFADAVCDEAETDAPIVLIQDYHFAFAPQVIRQRLPNSTIVTFWHIPWPEWQAYEICPWGPQIVEGLLGSSIVGFQTETDCRNFLDVVERSIEAHVDRDERSVTYGGRRVRVRVYPASVRWPGESTESRATARSTVCRQLDLRDDMLLAVGVDRLDYTKGLEEKFMAVERLLDWYPEYAGRFVLVQLAEPSRVRLPAYIDLRARVRAAAERINERFGSTDYCPIILMEGRHTSSDVSRFLQAADVCYVGSLHDGMNLVSKEFVRAREDEQGVLVLSEFAGAARELGEAVLINPYDIDGAAVSLAEALTMGEAEQRIRMRRMRRMVASFDAHRWGAEILYDATRLNGERGHAVGSAALTSA